MGINGLDGNVPKVDHAMNVGIHKFSLKLHILLHFQSCFFFFGLIPIWGRCIACSISTFSGLVLLSLLVSPSCVFL